MNPVRNDVVGCERFVFWLNPPDAGFSCLSQLLEKAWWGVAKKKKERTKNPINRLFCFFQEAQARLAALNGGLRKESRKRQPTGNLHTHTLLTHWWGDKNITNTYVPVSQSDKQNNNKLPISNHAKERNLIIVLHHRFHSCGINAHGKENHCSLQLILQGLFALCWWIIAATLKNYTNSHIWFNNDNETKILPTLISQPVNLTNKTTTKFQCQCRKNVIQRTDFTLNYARNWWPQQRKSQNVATNFFILIDAYSVVKK